jgi:hypothetical protein
VISRSRNGLESALVTTEKPKGTEIKLTIPGDKPKDPRPFGERVNDVPDLTDEEIADEHAKEHDKRQRGED